MEFQNNFIEMRVFVKGEYQGRYLIRQEDILSIKQEANDETLILIKFRFYKRHTERVYKVNESPEAIFKNRQFTVNFEK
ncbi:MAG: hypothetical protein IKB98_03430 [Clostridia bacterium]|nr:hypothetical protein [Clostridia bacterium]